jgi:hypothetical protein
VAVSLSVGDSDWTVGTGDFLHAFFSTVAANLEPAGWGSRFPLLMNDLYAGELGASNASAASEELAIVAAELRGLQPSEVVWDYEHRSLRPPWGDDISPEITDLSNYFVTSEGEDLIETLQAALDASARSGRPLTIG